MFRNLKKNPPLIVCLSFFALIFLGALLLDLPIASANGESLGFLNAFFTSTSASCVTGLIVVNTAEHWTAFGKVVIILLIQIGGLGTMVFLSLIAMALNKKIGITERRIIVEQTSADTSKGIIRLVIYIIKFSLTVEFIGAILLATRFIPDFGLEKGILYSLFHSVSAFCNAGFDILGDSLVTYVDSFTVNIVISLLIIFGGLGFTVFIDVFRKKNFKNLTLHSKVVISITLILLIIGTIAFFLIEYN
ncbi:potassium transporter TrkG, partial [Peptoniphilus senegalensis]